MKISTEYFGDIEINESDIINFEHGLLGFESCKRFVIISEPELFLEYLQCVDEDFSIPVMNPFLVKSDYELELPEKILSDLEIKEEKDVLIRTVVVIPEDITQIRTNLQSPIVINTHNKNARQIILDDSYPIRYCFYQKEEV